MGVWVHPWPEQLASEPILRIGVKRPGIFPVSLERDWLWLEREGWETVPSKPKVSWVQIKTQW